MSVNLARLVIHFLERPGLSKSTVKSYELALLPLLEKYGRFPIDSLTRLQIQQYLNSLTHLSYTTHNRHQTIIQGLLNFAVEQGYLAANPIAKLKHRKLNQDQGEHGSEEPVRYLNPQQLTLLYSLLEPNSRLHTLVLLLHQTGARVSEVLALQLEDVDLSNCRFQVIGKGNKRRWCFYSEAFALTLDNYLKLYRHPGCKALFTAQHPLTLKVTPMSYDTAYRDWVKLIAQSPELEGCHLHDLRHTFATERVGLMGIEELSALMGHSNIQTTLRYQKITSSQAEEVAKKALISLAEVNANVKP